MINLNLLGRTAFFLFKLIGVAEGDNISCLLQLLQMFSLGLCGFSSCFSHKPKSPMCLLFFSKKCCFFSQSFNPSSVLNHLSHWINLTVVLTASIRQGNLFFCHLAVSAITKKEENFTISILELKKEQEASISSLQVTE